MAAVNWSEVDEAIRGGHSTFEVWTQLGKTIGLTLEDIVMRKRGHSASNSPAHSKKRLGRGMPLFKGRTVSTRQLNLIPS